MKKENMTNERLYEYRRVAYYYYKRGMTQEEIAKKMQMSRQRVNRILGSCIELGIVQISIADIEGQYLDLESKLEQKYHLKEVRVAENVIEEHVHQDLGIAAGKYLESILEDKDIIGFTRGRATSALVDSMPPLSKTKDLTVTQLIGGDKEEQQTSIDEIVYRFSEKLHAKPSMLYAPVIVQSAELKEALMNDPFFIESYKVMKECRIAIVGIGTAKSQWKHMMQLYEDSENKIDTTWSKDVAGEVCTHFFDADGKEVIPPFSDRIIAITLEDYRKIPIRIGVAGLPEKAGAIKAALKGGYVNVLVTDRQTAEQLLT